MSMIDLDLSHYFAGFKAKSKTVNAVVNQAKEVYNMEHSSMLGGQLFNALYQRDPHLLNVDDPSNQYAQAVRAVLKSGQFLSLRNQTSGSLSWSAIGASILVDELAKRLYWENIPKPEQEEYNPPPGDPSEDDQPGNKESEDKPKPGENKGDNEKPDDSEDDTGDSNSDEESEDKSGDESEESNDESGDGQDDQPDNQNESDETKDGDDSDGESGDDESESDESSDDSDTSDESDDGNNGSDDRDDEPNLDEQKGEPIDKIVQDAVNRAGEKLDNMMNGLAAGAGDKEETFNDAIDLAELYTGLATNQGLSSLIELVGKLRLNTSFLPAMHVGEPEEVAEVELGDEIEKTLPSDLGLMFGSDEEFFQFMTKVENKELVQYRTVTHKQPGMGPIVICLDDSGSMSYSMKGSRFNRDQWAKSLAVAIYIQSIKENRPCAVVQFSTWAKLLVPKFGKLDGEFLNQLQGSANGGGTDFGVAWRKALKFITEDHEGRDFRDADITFITDGEGGYDPMSIAADKDQNNIRLVTIFLGSNQSMGMRKPAVSEWAKLSDAMCFVDQLNDRTEAEAFRIVKNHEITGIRDI